MQLFSEFAANHWELFLALALILGLLLKSLFGEKLQGYQSVDPIEAIGLINHQDAVVLDVRTDKEYSQGHILNSIHMPLGSLKNRMTELEKHKRKHIIVGCRSGQRSAGACGQLRKQGFEHVYNLRGGLMGWQNANLPLTKKG